MITMRMLVHDNLKVADIQERFREAFPNLCLEFYSDAPALRKESSPKEPVAGYKSLREIRNNHHEGYLEVKPDDTVKAVEELFREEFGLNVRVLFREAASRAFRHVRFRKLQAQ
jgi:hypothetical protein